MVKALLFVGWLLVVLMFAQTAWLFIRHWRKFRAYRQMWKRAERRFHEAARCFDSAAERRDESEMKRNHLLCHRIIREQLHYMRAQRAVMQDNFIPPWRWPARWNADYLKETEKAA